MPVQRSLPRVAPCRREKIDGTKDELRRARFEAAWRQNVSELSRRSLSWSGSHREDAEDALGETALTALKKWPAHELQPGEARGWLLRMLYNKCVDIYRQRKRSRGVDLAVDLEDSRIDLESELQQSELLAVVKDRIGSLPPRLREVAELYLLWDRPYSEIAVLLGITEVNARKRMQEARARLRKPLHAYLKEGAYVQVTPQDG